MKAVKSIKLIKKANGKIENDDYNKEKITNETELSIPQKAQFLIFTR